MKPWEQEYADPYNEDAGPWAIPFEQYSEGTQEGSKAQGETPVGKWISAEEAGVSIEEVVDPEGTLGVVEADGKMEAWTPLPGPEPTIAEPFPQLPFQTESGAPQKEVSSFDYTKDEIRLKQVMKDAFAEMQVPTRKEELSSQDIFSFTKKEEGTREKSYTLKDAKSGVTVASGLDVGQWTESGLKGLGLSKSLIEKVRPYIGKKGAEARKVHKELGGFKLTPQEVEEVDKILEKDATDTVNKDLTTKLGKTLDDYPIEAQQVMVSMYHNFGAKVFKYGTWKSLVEGNFTEAARRLRNKEEWKQNHARRAREAQLLAQISTPTEIPPTLAEKEPARPWERDFGSVS